MLIRLLGPVDVTVAGAAKPLPGLRRKAVLARLALRPGEVVSVDQLIDAVWDGEPPATAVNSLQSHVSYLRRALGAPEAILAQAPGYVLTVRETDLRRAEDLIQRARDIADPADRLAALTGAAGLWRGRQPLADVATLSWFAREADRLEQMRRAAEQAAVECRLMLGQHTMLVPELRDLTERHPFDEDLHGQLMIALYRSGRQAEALAVFHVLRDRLREELGLDPSGPQRDLVAAILRQDPGLDHAPVPARTGRLADGGAPLIERAAETSLIDQALDRAVATRTGQILIFEGPAGIGKTSLVNHAGKRAAALGMTTATARGTDLETDYAWGCVRQLFHRYAEADHLISADAQQPGDEFRILTALYLLTADLAARNPLVIVVDDLHWADTPAVQFLTFLAARLDALPVVLVLALRPGQDRIGRLVSAIAGLPHAVTRALRPLSPDGCAELLARVIDIEPDRQLVGQCHAMTSGNPFLMRELAAQLTASGGDVRTAVPEDSPGVTRFANQQLRYLPPAAVDVARALAVLGDEVGSDWLAQVTRTSPREAMDALVPLLADQLIVAAGIPARFSFAHPLIRASVYDSMPAALRTDLHLRAVDVAIRGQDPIKAATHLLRVPPRVGGPDPVEVLSLAAELSLASGSVSSAVNFLRRTLEEDLGERRTGMLTRLGMAEALVDSERAIERLSEALAGEPDPEARAQIRFGLASTLWLAGRPREAALVCQDSLARDQGMSAEARLSLRGCIAMVAYGTRHGTDLVALIDGFAAEPPHESVGGLILESGLALHDMYQNRRESAERRASRVIAGDRLLRLAMAEPTLTCAWYALIPCDSPALLPSVEAALAHNQKAGSSRGLAPSLCVRAEVMYAHGRLAEALRDARQAWEVCQFTTVGLGGMFIGNVLMLALVAHGKVEEAAKVLREVKAKQVANVTASLYAPGEIAVQLAMGQTRRAFETVLATRDECRWQPMNNPLATDWRAPLVRCLALLGRDEEARAAATEMLAVAGAWGTPRAVGRALRFAASVESRPHRLEMLAESVRLLAGTQANLEHAKSLHAFGAALAESGHLADARARLAAALDLAALCGARPLQDAVAAAVRRAGAAPGGASTPLSAPPGAVHPAIN
ncbi:BTAD domain-containing putative transcriptional regulator [Acrocarpospora macrocephala]|uniref:BTAD domain-containing putative transcriptional regulator n=1 Tax=Acrocarpospora macrocephala TaxID=150177 RepID=UPI00147972C7|nr:BTAD domain-containing putative transcriptional regulator [Acrocarpospora macrocephala]